MRIRIAAPLAAALALVPLASLDGAARAESSPTAVPRAACGPRSTPETGLQGQVPLADRQSGRSKQGYSCNLELLGRYQGEGTTWVNPQYAHCAYNATSFFGLGRKKSEGVQVLDVSDPRHPKLTANLTSPAMLTGTWESLKVNEARGLLAGVSVGPAIGTLAFDVYDIKADCAHPKLLNTFASADFTAPATTLNHEGAWSPDGNTYWATGVAGGSITAIDVSDPAKPSIEAVSGIGYANHGFSFSLDGRLMYLTTAFPAGVVVLDVGDVQTRKFNPQIRELGRITWGGPATVGQHTIPVSWNLKPYLITVDEFAGEDIHIIDSYDPKRLRVVRQLQLEVNRPENAAAVNADVAHNGLFGYDAHYCAVDRTSNPTALACGFFNSGIRVFDIRDPRNPHEIAYFNPPAQAGRNADLLGSEHAAHPVGYQGNGSNVDHLGPGVLANLFGPADLTADWCSSPPRFVGTDELWVSCQDNGFLALRFTNDAYRKP
ncbi:MAG TPA: hypothetical protein VNC22_02895 [Sporichthya sp.]|nr:hypothetical protein [Sporichthya sp.]